MTRTVTDGSIGRSGRQADTRLDLAAIVCCPQCRGTLAPHHPVRDTDGMLRDGGLFCPACQCMRACVSDYRIDFLRPDTAPQTATTGAIVPACRERRIDAGSGEIGFYGPWEPAGTFMRGSGDADCIAVFAGTFTGASLRLSTNPWSGIVSIQCDEDAPLRIDLYRPAGSMVAAVPLARDLPFGRHRLVLRTTGEKNPASNGRQVFLQELILKGPPGEGFAIRPPKNYGNPYSDWIMRRLSHLASDALILEVGGGDRRTENPRHVNLEYLQYELPDCFGDIHKLPFRDGTFEAICTQAVFEHVGNPFTAAEELVRITRPGGLILTEVAFLQPLHGVPYHYFNMTLDGLKTIFDRCEVVDEGWFGDFAQTVAWMAGVAGVKDRIAPSDWAELVRLLTLLDSKLDYAGQQFIASGVQLAVRCPATVS